MILDENLASIVKSEPKSKASREAKRLGLKYMGFGRYANKEGKISYIVDQKTDKLVPFKGREHLQKVYDQSFELKSKNEPKSFEKVNALDQQAKELSSLYSQRHREDKKILFFKSKEINGKKKLLSSIYNDTVFSDAEKSALKDYRDGAYESINQYLYNGYNPEDPSSAMGDWYVKTLDDAFEGTELPTPVSAYTGLGAEYTVDNLNPGQSYIFKGYISTSLDWHAPIDSFSQTQTKGKKDVKIVLQIDVSAGAKAIYLDGALNDESMENELLLRRGSKVKIISGPHMLDEDLLRGEFADADTNVALFHCELINDE